MTQRRSAEIWEMNFVTREAYKSVLLLPVIKKIEKVQRMSKSNQNLTSFLTAERYNKNTPNTAKYSQIQKNVHYHLPISCPSSTTKRSQRICNNAMLLLLSATALPRSWRIL